ncbi:GNAT family N-acetyltransferase [uncultured Aquimarina sp.]|uniref:GNAT family N-acetyltransferase n=1 Tax=uncultured Aquimarina sp. TaxID=575652 RepID=UPI0026319F75|nr:GNAT family N-acetyltransferase [uncultured Aquimarina sp.]
MIIETERLILREMVMDDAQDMLRLHSNHQVQKYTGENIITSLEEINNKIKEFQSRDKNRGFGRWVTILKKEKQFVGWAGLAYLPEFDEVDLGYRFLPEYWGLGIATEASHAILTYGFESLKLKKIIAIAMKENKSSIKVMEKVGMEFDKFAPYEPGSEDAAWYWCNKKLIIKNKAH